MESTFITIHDLSLDANILYCSQSINDILEYRPEEVVGRSAWNYFHPDEIPVAQAIHGRGVSLDKAAVLNYCRIRNKYGDWVGCECVFTVVYNVLVGCTSVYMNGPKSHKRATEAPVIRQLFSSSPRDPRYHMLSYISTKFSSGPRPHTHEPRAALFLNRFTRTLTINFATDGLSKLLGISADELTGQSFYYCIQENCLAEAIRCLESAKANDSIAYLRFWYRDPRLDGFGDHDDIMSDVYSTGSSDEDEGGVQLTASRRGSTNREDRAVSENAIASDSNSSAPPSTHNTHLSVNSLEDPSSRTSSGTDMGNDSANAMWDKSPDTKSETSGSSMWLDSPKPQARRLGPQQPPVIPQPRQNVELEAVVSCTSDGLVVILRAARPFVLESVRVPPQRQSHPFANGLFASPWATVPVMPDPTRFSPYENYPTTGMQAKASPVQGAQWQPQPAAMRSNGDSLPTSARAPIAGPPLNDFMNSIRDVAVFAWALTGINGSLSTYSKGRPMEGAVPFDGMPVWDPDGSLGRQQMTANGIGANGFSQGSAEDKVGKPWVHVESRGVLDEAAEIQSTMRKEKDEMDFETKDHVL